MSNATAAPWPDHIRRKLVAILRGVTPDEVVDIGRKLVAAGIEAIEVPLNSPDPFVSIEKLVNDLPGGTLIGAGTVLQPEQVDRLAEAGGKLVVSPNCNTLVIRRSAQLGMVSMPGVFTPTEAFAALDAGATALKFFPAGQLGVSGISAVKAVLPKDAVIAAVGGVSDTNFADYWKAGCRAFGLGSSLYKPGMSADDVAEKAVAAVAAWDAIAVG